MTPKADILQGTLDMLVLRAVADEALHGYALVHRLKLISGDRLHIPQGSLYPALHRLENQGLLARRADPTDGRRCFITLSEKALEAMNAYFRTVPAGSALI